MWHPDWRLVRPLPCGTRQGSMLGLRPRSCGSSTYARAAGHMSYLLARMQQSCYMIQSCYMVAIAAALDALSIVLHSLSLSSHTLTVLHSLSA